MKLSFARVDIPDQLCNKYALPHGKAVDDDEFRNCLD